MQVRIGSVSRAFLTGFVALFLSAFAASAAGIYLGSVSDLIVLLPGIMIMVPPSINMRGSISGVLASRLSSTMHLGEFDMDFSGDGVLGANLRASFMVTVIIAFILGLIAWAVSLFFGIEGLSVIDFVIISVISGILSGLIVMGITLVVAYISYRYGLDLDMIASPTVTTSGDIVTLPMLVLTTLVVLQMGPAVRSGLFLGIIILTALSFVYVAVGNSKVREIGREIIPLLAFLSFIGTLAGLTYTLDLDQLVEYGVFLIIITPFAGMCGSIGGIVCSRLATGMHTGAIEPTLVPEREVFRHFGMSYAYMIIIMPLITLIAYISAHFLGLGSPEIGSLLVAVVAAALVVMTLVSCIAYATAGLSFRYGLDPDNFGIPVITATIDLIGAAVLVSVIHMLV
ncbi:magnesium transporter MgtE [Methanomicrobiaceae archaeon CYW5]|uniref:magnesium transporter n=1 Tax=Methanovulcanius yangii TaxID=1789227 RepID=UPI0029CA0FFB|nr:magnesium transporter [Methanovulcanius yangii]MBT8507789.1 magnesium transporter MgtE [Methanovulcanius yangii]